MDEIRKGAGGLRHVKEEEKSKKPSTDSRSGQILFLFKNKKFREIKIDRLFPFFLIRINGSNQRWNHIEKSGAG